MRVLSIDVGIKNLACCVLDIHETSKSYQIVYWNVIDMCDEKQHCAQCKKRPATYHSPSAHQPTPYCTLCGKKSQFKMPLPIPKKANKGALAEIAKAWGVTEPLHKTKDGILKQISHHNCESTLIKVERKSASSMPLVDIGKAMRKHLEIAEFLSVDTVLIENQIGPLANRMKAIQAMLALFFLMKGIDNIEFVSAAKKLKGISKKTTYKERKALGIEETRKRVPDGKWRTHFETHTKKDDLADCFLQAICTKVE